MTKLTPKRSSVVPETPGPQLEPPLIVRSTVPLSPTIQPRSSVTKLTALRFAGTPE
ncbi:MAG: hypothetical protein IPK58_01430 [Acidobacteria bacterium]|nr:hypothetical protein [Acidobacteriota bacterium]